MEKNDMKTLDRRALIRSGVVGVSGLFAASLLFPRRAAAASARARSVVWLWLNGGPSHIDTFDPKPGTPQGGPFKAIKTRAKGMEISEHLPHLAELGDRFSLVRSMTSREGNHDRARYLVHSGYAPTPTVQHPALGAWVSKELSRGGLELPRFVSIGGPSLGGGFLGVEHAPFVLRPGKTPDNIELPPMVDRDRFERRRQFLASLESSFADETGDSKVKARRAVYDGAVKMMQSTQLAAFDLEREPEKVRAAYGDHDFGRGCLTARRLVEVGVPFVEVTLDGWDTHKDNFERTKKLMSMLDSASATLFRELEERRLLASTLVVVAGEFGRTPNINANDGRDHHPKAWSLLLGGGGVRSGIVYGKTTLDGDTVADQPVTVPDLFATLATLLGMDPEETVLTPAGRPISLTDHGRPVRELIAI
jgi:hypothetical protein